MKIGIVGYGYVGKVLFNYFNTNIFETIFYDPYISNSCSKNDINDCYLAIVCVNTPENNNGSCDISIIEEVIKWINTPLILIKSTVSIGTTQRLIDTTGKRIVFSPEYIGESTYDTGHNFINNEKNHSFYIFGGNKKDTTELVSIFQLISGPVKVYKQTDATVAEIAKYMENCFFATKVTFCHEFNQICAINNVDYNEVRECWLLDPRINKSHTCIFINKINPFDGKCLPKDLHGLIYDCISKGYEPHLLQEIDKSNNRIALINNKKKSTFI